jgi:carbohydrate diacid regulator
LRIPSSDDDRGARDRVVVGIGTAAKHLRELADRYKEAQVAIEVGKVFDDDKSVIHYENLGLGRIIYQIPTTLCEMFLSEVFKKNPSKPRSGDALHINKFFENNLTSPRPAASCSSTATPWSIPSGKDQAADGLDLREFDHAIIFKVALMVKKYLNSQEQQ